MSTDGKWFTYTWKLEASSEASPRSLGQQCQTLTRRELWSDHHQKHEQGSHLPERHHCGAEQNEPPFSSNQSLMHRWMAHLCKQKAKKPLPWCGLIPTVVGQSWLQSPCGSSPWCLCAMPTNCPAVWNIPVSGTVSIMQALHGINRKKGFILLSCVYSRNTYWTSDLI